MPNTQSAKKRLRQNVVLRARNRSVKSAMRTEIKKVVSLCEEGKVAEAEEQYKVAAKKLDQAGGKNVIHKNAAARKKSRLQRIIKAAKQG